MAGHGDEVAEVGRWADGIDQVHRCIVGRFRRQEPGRGYFDRRQNRLRIVAGKFVNLRSTVGSTIFYMWLDRTVKSPRLLIRPL